MDILDDPFRITLSQQAYANGYIRLPWANRPFAMGAGFSVTLAEQTRNCPFLQQSAFDPEGLSQAKYVYRKYMGCAGSFRSRTSTASSSSSEHLSVGFGATIGNDYLNASVTGSYDKALMSNKDVSAHRSQHPPDMAVYPHPVLLSGSCKGSDGSGPSWVPLPKHVF